MASSRDSTCEPVGRSVEKESSEGVHVSKESKAATQNVAPVGESESSSTSTRKQDEKDDTKNAAEGSDTEEPPLSKKQIRKRRRLERIREKNNKKKQKVREAKHAKAIAEGRDLDEERRLQAERTMSGEGWKRRQAFWLQKMEKAETSFQVCIDCAYEEQMTPKEINSLASQIRYCYAANKKSVNPVYLSVSSLAGITRTHLEKVAGFPDQWTARAFDCSDKSLIEMHSKEKLVYLTGDAENTLEHLEDNKVYVIGGIVDRNRLHRTAITRAQNLGVATAKLPIDSHLKLFTTKVLTCNHVFEILLKYRQHGNDWKKAMLDVLPARKDAQELGNSLNSESCEAETSRKVASPNDEQVLVADKEEAVAGKAKNPEEKS